MASFLKEYTRLLKTNSFNKKGRFFYKLSLLYSCALGLKRELLCEEQGGCDHWGVQAKRRRALWAAQSQVDKMDAPHVLSMLFWQVDYYYSLCNVHIF